MSTTVDFFVKLNGFPMDETIDISWDFGDGNSLNNVTDTSAYNVYTTSGDYVVSLTVNNFTRKKVVHVE